MDDLLREFLTETGEHIDIVDVQLVEFEQNTNNDAILRNVFRLVHTIKGTCGFLGLPRLEALAHAAETLMGKYRDGYPVTTQGVTLILLTIDRIKLILSDLERTEKEIPGDDRDLIDELEHLAMADMSAKGESILTVGELAFQVLERPLRPGENSLDDLERAFRDAPVEVDVPVISNLQDNTVVAERETALSSPVSDAQNAVDAVVQDEGKAKNQSIRVSVDTLEHMMTMVSELVLTRNQLLEIARRHDENDYKVPLQRLSHVTAELQEGVMKTRMQPIGTAWQKLPRVVRDLSNDLGKSIDLVTIGAETELDRQVLELIKDPLTHMIRNSADHGIETPAERLAAGKSERGKIRLSASHEGGTISIEIADDGRGLDLVTIKRVAVERGLVSESEIGRMQDSQIAKFIFHPGFSTAKKVTSVSGRGVGMDVVRANIELIGGTVDIITETGKGTSFSIKIPLTLAIVAALIVSAGGQRFAVPQVSVLELVRVRNGSEHQVERINGAPVLRLRDRLLPIIPLASSMELADMEQSLDDGFIVVTQVGRQHFGMLVDGVFHTEEIVVKPMSKKLRHIQYFSGNTILGDGAVVLIIDPSGVARSVGSSEADNVSQFADHAAVAVEDVAETTTLLVFRTSGESYKAVPLSLVTRLEEVDATKIEHIGDKPMLQYRGKLMPLVKTDDTAIRSEGTQPLVVFSDGERSMGLVVDEIVDIVDEVLDVEPMVDRADLIGTAVVRGRATEIVNVAHYLPLAHEDWLRRPSSMIDATIRSVLLVDDSAFFRDLLAPVLKAAGYRVITANSSEQALAALKRERGIDVVVADIEMPGNSGFDLAADIRANPLTADLPIIALSSYAHQTSIDQARRVGITDFVAKFDRSGLLSAIAETLPAMGEAA
jgi:two-component system, chemotaxis family, sensor kinase CheA